MSCTSNKFQIYCDVINHLIMNQEIYAPQKLISHERFKKRKSERDTFKIDVTVKS